MKPSDQPVSLDWNMTAGAGALEITYTLVNHTDARIWVAETLTVQQTGVRTPAPDRVVVGPDATPGVARFSRDIVETNAEVALPYVPLLVAVEAGASHQGHATVPLPLVGWHNYAPADPVPAGAKSAVLEIAWLAGEGEWGSVGMQDGTSVSAPQLGWYMRERKVVRGGVLGLP